MPGDLIVRARELGGALDDFVAGDGAAQLRVSRAGTTARFLVEDDGAESVTLLLDRRPPATCHGPGVDAEITVRLSGEQAGAMARGELVLATAILTGDVRVSGPVRKYLAVEPILRASLRAAAARA